jgi:hypothetical protein
LADFTSEKAQNLPIRSSNGPNVPQTLPLFQLPDYASFVDKKSQRTLMKIESLSLTPRFNEVWHCLTPIPQLFQQFADQLRPFSRRADSVAAPVAP